MASEPSEHLCGHTLPNPEGLEFEIRLSKSEIGTGKFAAASRVAQKIAWLLHNRYGMGVVDAAELIDRALLRERNAQREADAKLCDDVANEHRSIGSAQTLSWEIAAKRIRATKEQEPT